jgi:hypothetical protein
MLFTNVQEYRQFLSDVPKEQRAFYQVLAFTQTYKYLIEFYDIDFPLTEQYDTMEKIR